MVLCWLVLSKAFDWEDHNIRSHKIWGWVGCLCVAYSPGERLWVYNKTGKSVIGRLLGADYRPTDNRPVPYRCISTLYCKWAFALHFICLSVSSTSRVTESCRQIWNSMDKKRPVLKWFEPTIGKNILLRVTYGTARYPTSYGHKWHRKARRQ